jgi:hypothetical protein
MLAFGSTVSDIVRFSTYAAKTRSVTLLRDEKAFVVPSLSKRSTLM